MNFFPQRSDYGLITDFHRRLAQELLHAGYSVPRIRKMSTSKALLARYGSAQAVDEALVDGIYKGVKASAGKFTKHRVLWDRARRELESEYIAALASLQASVERCLAVGVIDVAIVNMVEDQVHPSNRSLAA